MNRDELFEGIGGLDDDLLERSEQRAGGKKLWTRWCVAAACMVLIIGTAVYGGLTLVPQSSDSGPELESIAMNLIPLPSQDPGEAGDITAVPKEQEEAFIAVADLMPQESINSSSENFIENMSLQIFRTRLYEKYDALYAVSSPSIADETLKASLGRMIDNDVLRGSQEEFFQRYELYRISGHKDLQYVILRDKEADSYTLLEFDHIQDTDFSYQDVLELVYGISSGEDIAQVRVNPSKRISSDEGKAIQEEIGELEITDQEDIRALYDILCSMTCYGPDNWDKVLNGDGDAPADVPMPYSLLEGFRRERYLTIVTTWGNEIDTLKYTGVGGMFFEFGGVAYNALSGEDAAATAEILGIQVDP